MVIGNALNAKEKNITGKYLGNVKFLLLILRLNYIKAASTVSSAVRYANAQHKWRAAGKPLRTEEEINHIFNNICVPCEHFLKKNATSGRCKLCGCCTSSNPQPMLGIVETNKIAMSTENCPINKW